VDTDKLSGRTVAALRATIDASLAGRAVCPAPEFVCITLGVNDSPDNVDTAGEQTTWTTNASYIIDAIHTAWPNTQVYWGLPWKRGASYTATLNILGDTLIPALATGRSWFHVGPDERVWCENGDDGATYTSDGLHYNAAGEAKAAEVWMTAMGTP
jgi:lysophospholipase L1-like esterase